MKALITGDRGFVGRHFSNFLKERDWDVYGLDIVNGRDEDAIPYFIEDTTERFDLVVHCAYEVGGRAHIDGRNTALNTNLTLDASMFSWAINGGASAVLYFSSSAAYPVELQSKLNNVRLKETDIDLYDIKQPDSNYGWAKLTGEMLARNAQALGLRVHVVRPFSGYGSDQGLEYPFPSIVKRALAGTLEVWGPTGQTRDWIHISDVVAGAFAVYEANVATPINLCTGTPTEMGVLAKLVGGNYPVTYLEDMPYGVFSRVGDPTEMFKIYQPKMTLMDGIKEAVERLS